MIKKMKTRREGNDFYLRGWSILQVTTYRKKSIAKNTMRSWLLAFMDLARSYKKLQLLLKSWIFQLTVVFIPLSTYLNSRRQWEIIPQVKFQPKINSEVELQATPSTLLGEQCSWMLGSFCSMGAVACIGKHLGKYSADEWPFHWIPPWGQGEASNRM